MSYGLTCNLLAEVLPLDQKLSPRSVRRHLHHVAQRLEDDLGDEVGMIGGPQAAMPASDDRPPPPMTVGLDGGYVHAREGSNRRAGWFEVMVGKSIPDNGEAKCFAMVQTLDLKPRRRLDAVLGAQGLAQRQSIRFVSDGGDTVRNLQQHLHAEGEHWLDWFHITMRITVMRQMAKSITSAETSGLAARIDRDLARIKWLIWHGNHIDGAEAADLLTWDLELADNKDAAAKLEKALDNSAAISARMPFLSQTMATSGAMASASRRASPSQPSIRFCPGAWSRNSKCAGPKEVHTYCCKPALKPSMVTCANASNAGILT